MRILYLSPWFPYPLDTGSRTRAYYLLKAMAEQHSVSLLTLNPKGWEAPQMDAVNPLCERMTLIDEDPFRRGKWHRATRFFSLRPIVAAPFPKGLEVVRCWHQEEPFDVVIAASVVMAYYALALSDVVYILEEHNSHTRWMLDRYRQQRSWSQQLRCWASWKKSVAFESHLFRRFDLVTMVSEQDAAVTRGLIRGGYPSVVVFPNGVDCQRLQPDLYRSQPYTIIFSGALSYYANYEAMHFFLKEVYPIVRQDYPQVSLRITGSYQDVDLTNLSLDESVVLTGFVEDIRAEIGQATVSVVPILSGGGTRLKILEAMALGTPVVSTTKGAEGLEVIDGEHILLADTPAHFAKQITRLFQRGELQQKLTTNARQLVEHRYHWGKIGADFVQLVEKTVWA